MTKLKVVRQPKSNNVLRREQRKNLAWRRRAALKSGSSIDVSSSSHPGPSLFRLNEVARVSRSPRSDCFVSGRDAFKHITHPQHLLTLLAPNICSFLAKMVVSIVQSHFVKKLKKSAKSWVWLIDLLAVFLWAAGRICLRLNPSWVECCHRDLILYAPSKRIYEGKFIGRHAASDDDKTRRMQISDLFLSAGYLLSAHKSSANLSRRSSAYTGPAAAILQGACRRSPRIDTFYVSISSDLREDITFSKMRFREVLKSLPSIIVIFARRYQENAFCWASQRHII